MNTRSRSLIGASALVMAGLVAPEARSQSFTGQGFLPGGTQSAAARSSADGSVVVGSSGGNRAFLWTRAGGMVDLGALGGGTTAYAADVSDDGSVVVGTSYAPEGPRVFRWTVAGGIPERVPFLPPPGSDGLDPDQRQRRQPGWLDDCRHGQAQ